MAEKEDNREFIDTINKLKKAIEELSASATMPSEEGGNIEKEREQTERENQGNEYLKIIADAAGGGSSGADAEKAGKKGGLLAGIGGALGGMGIGAGVAMGGLGALFAGGGYLLKQLAEFDGKAVVKNVKELFKIAELTDGIGDAFSKGGAFLATMTSIGVGLAIFGVGSAIAGLSDGLTNFVNPKWAKSIVDNVVTLLGISDKLGGAKELMGKAGTFFLAMTGIGVGLAIFGVGSAIAGLGMGLANFINPLWAQSIVDNVVILLSLSKAVGGIGTALAQGGTFFLAMTGIGLGLAIFGVGSAAVGLAQFVTKDDWATRVVDSVTKLLSISTHVGGVGKALGKAGTFVIAMTGIAAGLAVFAVGSALTGLTQFMSADDWATKIVDSVKKLMEISALKFGDIAKFTVFMAAVAAGLVAFAVGKVGNAMGDVIGKFTGNFADNIVKDVNTLMGMVNDPNISQAKANSFVKVMSTIAVGLTAFGAGKFISSLAGAAASVMSFLTGTESPIKQMETIAKNADELKKGAAAIGSIAENLDKVGNLKFKGGDLGIKDFAKDLLQSIPDIETAISGGEVSKGMLSMIPGFGKTKLKGLGSKDIPWEQAGINLRMIHEALNMPKGDHGTSTEALKKGGDSLWQDKLQKSIEILTEAIIAGGGTNVNVNQATAPTTVIGRENAPRLRVDMVG